MESEKNALINDLKSAKDEEMKKMKEEHEAEMKF